MRRNGGPAQPRLRAFQDKKLEQRPVVVDFCSPLMVMVGLQEVASIGPVAALHLSPTILDIVQTEISGLSPEGGIHRNFRLPRKNRYYVRELRIVDFGTTLIFSILFGSLGMGYFVYGKKQQAIVPLVAGLALCIFPYFVSSLYLMVLVGIVLTVLPWMV